MSSYPSKKKSNKKRNNKILKVGGALAALGTTYYI